MKELFIDAHEELIDQYMADHPEADWDEASEATADGAYDHMRDRLADMADTVRLQAKEGRLEGRVEPR